MLKTLSSIHDKSLTLLTQINCFPKFFSSHRGHCCVQPLMMSPANCPALESIGGRDHGAEHGSRREPKHQKTYASVAVLTCPNPTVFTYTI